MPRGSRPGERRGGRQRGTLNKKTVLRNAAIKAAALHSNLSPLDFLLGLMRKFQFTPGPSCQSGSVGTAVGALENQGWLRQPARPGEKSG